MDANTAIQVTGLGKKYIIGHQTGRRDTFRDVLSHAGSSMFRAIGAMATGKGLYSGNEFEEFWALRGLDFEIKQGDVVGVIGRNGAGKSTLLKVLSRITEPSEGTVKIRGRVASLLEVGTGFHPELSGRENIFLNGAILGMGRAEIKRKFDEIVDFAGVEKFLDTPVKRYSSGMYVRLAFSVAAHLEPEILIVDEVLAVGDSEFQQKCLGKMQDVAGHGRTVLFVSHNMAAVRQLCDRGIYLVNGQCQFLGPIDDTISKYLERGSDVSWELPGAPRGEIALTSAAIRDVHVDTNKTTVAISVEIHARQAQNCAIDFLIKDRSMTSVAFASNGTFTADTPLRVEAGRNKFDLVVTLPPMALGGYFGSIYLTKPFSMFFDQHEDILRFEISHVVGGTSQPLNQDWGFGSVAGKITTSSVA